MSGNPDVRSRLPLPSVANKFESLPITSKEIAAWMENGRKFYIFWKMAGQQAWMMSSNHTSITDLSYCFFAVEKSCYCTSIGSCYSN